MEMEMDIHWIYWRKLPQRSKREENGIKQKEASDYDANLTSGKRGGRRGDVQECLRHSMAVRKAGQPNRSPEQRLPIGGVQVAGTSQAFRPADPGVGQDIYRRQNEHRFIQCIGYKLGCRECLESIYCNYLLDGCLTQWAVSSGCRNYPVQRASLACQSCLLISED